MNKGRKESLEKLGWPQEILSLLESGCDISASDRKFMEGTKSALASMGIGPLEYMQSQPGVPLSRLAQPLAELNKWSCPIGLALAIFEAAAAKTKLRDVAQDMLARGICEAFPEGWNHIANVHPIVKLSSWGQRELELTAQDSQIEHYIDEMMRHLSDHPPPNGWKPEPKDDPILDDLFDRYWPTSRERPV